MQCTTFNRELDRGAFCGAAVGGKCTDDDNEIHGNPGQGSEWGAHCAGSHFRTKLMSRYIGVGPNDRFDVRIQELVSKAKIPGGFF